MFNTWNDVLKLRSALASKYRLREINFTYGVCDLAKVQTGQE